MGRNGAPSASLWQPLMPRPSARAFAAWPCLARHVAPVNTSAHAVCAESRWRVRQGGPSARDMELAAQQQQLALMYQQQLLLQQFSFAQAAAAGAAGRMPAGPGGSFGAWGPPAGGPAPSQGGWPGSSLGGGASLGPSGLYSMPSMAPGHPGAAATAPVRPGLPPSAAAARGNSAPDALAAAGAAHACGGNGATSAHKPAPGGCARPGSLPLGPGLGSLGEGGEGGLAAANGELSAPGEPSRRERRAQALHKYKQKRKNLCFTKKIRYESRKQLAQARPRIKGQFVRVAAAASAGDPAADASAGALVAAPGGAPLVGGPLDERAPAVAVAPPFAAAAAAEAAVAAPADGRDVGEGQRAAGMGGARIAAAEDDDEDNVVNSHGEPAARVRTPLLSACCLCTTRRN